LICKNLSVGSGLPGDAGGGQGTGPTEGSGSCETGAEMGAFEPPPS